jgi:hypothetical protein
LGERIGEFLFKGVLYILYGRRAGETREEKIARVSLIIGTLVVIFLIISALSALIRGLFVVDVPAPVEWGVPPGWEAPPPPGEMPPPGDMPMPPMPPERGMPPPKVP